MLKKSFQVKVKLLQRELDTVVETGLYTEKFGEQVLAFVDKVVGGSNIATDMDSFEIEEIIRPRIMMALLERAFAYDKDSQQADYYMGMIANHALFEARNAVYKERRGIESAFSIDDEHAFDMEDTEDVEAVRSILVISVTGTSKKKIKITK